ncbi:MAG: H-NS histone family protein [Zoogloeaceae bacterium]|jgi:DNA-binding protein H-NS|nr:H-NS histone family protein [Zoogloeaceae bacterium]
MSTYDEIQDQIKKLQEQAKTVQQAEANAVIADVKAKIAKYGLTAAQLGFGAVTRKWKSAKKAAKSKSVMYRKGDLTWSGSKRGRKPQWILSALAAGENIEKYRV